MNLRQEKILELLNKSDTWIKGKELSIILDVSDRTIRSDIDKLNQEFPGIVQSSTRQGYALDFDVYSQFITQTTETIPQTPEERAVYITKRLLSDDPHLTIRQLEDILFISENTIERDLKRVHELVFPYKGLKLVRENKEIRFEGDERVKRKLYRDLLESELQNNFLNLNRTASLYEKFDLLYVTDVLNAILEEKNYNIRQTAIPMIIVHLGISIERMLSGNYLEENTRRDEISKTLEYSIAQEYYDRISNSIPIDFKEAEVLGLAFLLMGYKNAEILEEKVRYNDLEYNVSNVIEKIIEHVKSRYDIDLSEDTDFKNGLHVHIQSLVGRAVNDNIIPNVHLQEIKRTFPLIFEMGLSVGQIIANEMNIAVSESESGFLSLHIGAAYERLSHEHKYSVMLIAPSNRSLSKLTKGKITNMFKTRLMITEIFEYYIESEVEASNVDLIISTLPIEHELNIPTIQISMFVNHEDESKIFSALNELDKRRFDLEFKTRFGTLIDERFFYVNHKGKSDVEIIDFMSDELYKEGIVDSNFKESVRERERMSSTSFVYSVAIPHALELKSKKSKIGIALLDKPIRWGSYDVKIVMLLAISEEDSSLMWSFFDWLAEIIDDTEKLTRLMQSKNRNEFVHWIMND